MCFQTIHSLDSRTIDIAAVLPSIMYRYSASETSSSQRLVDLFEVSGTEQILVREPSVIHTWRRGSLIGGWIACNSQLFGRLACCHSLTSLFQSSSPSQRAICPRFEDRKKWSWPRFDFQHSAQQIDVLTYSVVERASFAEDSPSEPFQGYRF